MVDKIWYNMEELIGGSEERGINRNILECKVTSLNGDGVVVGVLIETYWNVKFASTENQMQQPNSINRNILECKGVCVWFGCGAGCGINRNILECKVRLREIVSTRRSGINRNILECKERNQGDR